MLSREHVPKKYLLSKINKWARQMTIILIIINPIQTKRAFGAPLQKIK